MLRVSSPIQMFSLPTMVIILCDLNHKITSSVWFLEAEASFIVHPTVNVTRTEQFYYSAAARHVC